MAKKISEQYRLRAFAYYSMATDHYAKAREFEMACSELLGAPEGEFLDWVSDGIYGHDHRNPLAFDRVLKRAGITVAPKKARKGHQ